jgi:hypothetical protein
MVFLLMGQFDFDQGKDVPVYENAVAHALNIILKLRFSQKKSPGMHPMKSLYLLVVAGLLFTAASAQDHHERQGSIDVLSYRFEIDLNDTSNQVRGVADMEIAFLQDLDHFALDLRGIDSDSTGMKVHAITMNGKEVIYQQLTDQIVLTGVGARRGEKQDLPDQIQRDSRRRTDYLQK